MHSIMWLQQAVPLFRCSAGSLSSAPNLRLQDHKYRSFRRRDLEAKSSQRNHMKADLDARRALVPQLPYPFSSSRHGRAVLKITITDLSDGQRWSLQGQLVGQWAVVLQSTWREARRTHDTQKC